LAPGRLEMEPTLPEHLWMLRTNPSYHALLIFPEAVRFEVVLKKERSKLAVDDWELLELFPIQHAEK